MNLDNARQFWELLKEKDLDAFITAHPASYAPDDYQAIKGLYRAFNDAHGKIRSNPIAKLP